MRNISFQFKALISAVIIVLCTDICIVPAYGEKQKKELQLQEGDVKILASGTSTTENEAIATALRSALEQAFGTFVSANTTLVNDALVKDEIVSITTGNIKHYDIINSTLLPNGNTAILLNAIVSTSNLVKYAQNHGSSTELAGNKLAIAMRLEQANLESEQTARKNLFEQLYSIIPELFDYEIETGDPIMLSTSKCQIPIIIKVKSNKNTQSFQNILKSFLASIPNTSDKVQNVEVVHIVYDGIEKTLQKQWIYSFRELFYDEIVPQISAFKIVDQNEKILGALSLAPVRKGDFEHRVIMVGNLTHTGFNPPKSFFTGSLNHTEFGASTKAPSHIKFNFETGSLTPGVFFGSENQKYFLFPFPKIPDNTATETQNKKTKKKKDIDAKDMCNETPLYIIEGLALEFNIEEVNGITEIKVLPEKSDYITHLKSGEYGHYKAVTSPILCGEIMPKDSDKDNSSANAFIMFLLNDILKKDLPTPAGGYYHDYGIRIESDGTIPGTNIKLGISTFSSPKVNGTPTNMIIYFKKYYWGEIEYDGWTYYQGVGYTYYVRDAVDILNPGDYH